MRGALGCVFATERSMDEEAQKTRSLEGPIFPGIFLVAMRKRGDEDGVAFRSCPRTVGTEAVVRYFRRPQK